jgi:large subunit ribosomal protein L30
MGRLPPTRKYRKRKPGVDRPLPPAGKGSLRIRQVRSGSGHSGRLKRTLEALGLKHHQDEVVHADHPALRGMLYKVRHLVEVTTSTNPAAAPRGTRKKAHAKAEG